MRRGKVIVVSAAALVVVAVAAGWYFGSPWWTLWRMREAAKAGDVRTLASFIDREALESQAKSEARSWWRSVLAKPLAGNPEGDRRWIRRAKENLVKIAKGPVFGLDQVRTWLAEIPIRPGRLDDRLGRYDPYIVHRGLDRFEVRDRGASEEYGPLLSFRRHGLGWKLEGVRWGQQ
jgi:hypothetical protein